VLPDDPSTRSAGNVIAGGSAITVTPVQGVPEATTAFLGRLNGRLRQAD
jgi:hypothetical protein